MNRLLIRMPRKHIWGYNTMPSRCRIQVYNVVLILLRVGWTFWVLGGGFAWWFVRLGQLDPWNVHSVELGIWHLSLEKQEISHNRYDKDPRSCHRQGECSQVSPHHQSCLPVYNVLVKLKKRRNIVIYSRGYNSSSSWKS